MDLDLRLLSASHSRRRRKASARDVLSPQRPAASLSRTDSRRIRLGKNHHRSSAALIEILSFGAGKPDSVLHLAALQSSFLSRRLAPARLPRSRAAREDAAYPWLLDGPPSHLFCLAPDGVFRAFPLARNAVGSYSTFSPSLHHATSAGIRRKCFHSRLGLRSPHVRSSLFSVTLSVDTP